MADIVMPILETERLHIRRFTLDDLDASLTLLSPADRRENPALDREARAQQAAWLRWQVGSYDALERLYQPPYGDRAVVLRATGALIGQVGLVQAYGPFGTLPSAVQRAGVQDRLNTPEVGLFWSVHPAQRGQGYATEAAAALIRFAFDRMRLSRIVATTEHDNIASQGVMRKLGMTIERNPYPEPVWFQTVGTLQNRSTD